MSVWRAVEPTSLIMIPSVDEISDYEGDSLYSCGLDIVEESIKALINKAIGDFFRNADPFDPHAHSPRFGDINEHRYHYAGAFPEVIFQVAISLVSGGMGVGIYNLLSLWVKTKNGRKIHVKLPNGIVVDATQMTYTEFTGFLAEVCNVFEQHEHPKRIVEYINTKSIKALSDEDQLKILLKLQKALHKKTMEQLAKLDDKK